MNIHSTITFQDTKNDSSNTGLLEDPDIFKHDVDLYICIEEIACPWTHHGLKEMEDNPASGVNCVCLTGNANHNGHRLGDGLSNGSEEAQRRRCSAPDGQISAELESISSTTHGTEMKDTCDWAESKWDTQESFQYAQYVEISATHIMTDPNVDEKCIFCLIVKDHARTIGDLPDEYLRDIGPVVKKVALSTGIEQYNVLQNNGKMAFQHVDHVHFHVIPKPNEEEGLVLSETSSFVQKQVSKEELAATLEKMKGRLQRPADDSGQITPSLWSNRFRTTTRVIVEHALKHTGVGIVCAVAYFDPGNWGVDLQAGSEYGYKLLFVVLLSGIFALFLQSLASKLGVVTGLDLASHCRLLLYHRPRHTRLFRWLGLYPLYALSEVAIIATDLAELFGIGHCFVHAIPQTAALVGSSARAPGQDVRALNLHLVEVNWNKAFDGYVPSKAIFQSGALYTSVGILGATVMPHALFLGSALATQDRVSPKPDKSLSESSTFDSTFSTSSIGGVLRRRFSAGKIWEGIVAQCRAPPNDPDVTECKSHADRENNTLSFVKAHLYHGIADIIISLLGFAVMINSLILILSAAVFFYSEGPNGPGSYRDSASLFDAHDLIAREVGRGAAVMFALALLCAGQSSSIIATVAGQNVSEGFIRWRTSPVLRRIYTRLLGLIPSMVVAIAVGRRGIDMLLVVSQVVLSIVLPFIVFPLIWLTSSKSIMSIRSHPPSPTELSDDPSKSSPADPTPVPVDGEQSANVEEARSGETVYYSNGWLVTGIGYGIWLIIVVANAYVLVTLMMGKGG
ncbi:hypothetical protein EW146_g2684 [Bondarzewia mesenterica]|uniref:HIT domain-containing protein n=1 Tax=Bondarzewia mesenterica TaxID=1095465 RepID=A0A4S4LZY9_9AGAM|nr:hypothetical protein EW146_g2684 [Bondarzewia mesenterica]